MELCNCFATEVSFEWFSHRISSTDLKFRVTNNLKELKQGPADVSVKSTSRCIYNIQM